MLKSTPEADQAASDDVGELTLRALFDREESGMLRYAFSLTARRAVAEEIVQEVFLQLHAKWGQVESPRAWLYRSVRNRAFNYLRKSKREASCMDDTALNSASQADDESPDARLLQLETCAAIRQVLDELPETDRQLVQLKYFEGLRYREISERTGLSIGNVGFRLHKIIHQLACGLRPLGIDEVP